MHLEVRAIASPLACPPDSCTRVGLIVPRFRQSAVARNRLKRRLRELVRTRMLPSGVTVDVVIRIRPDAYRASFADLGRDVDKAVAQLARWRPTSESAPDANVNHLPTERSDS